MSMTEPDIDIDFSFTISKFIMHFMITLTKIDIVKIETDIDICLVLVFQHRICYSNLNKLMLMF